MQCKLHLEIWSSSKDVVSEIRNGCWYTNTQRTGTSRKHCGPGPGNDRSFVWTWAQRLKIYVGIARGLAYLHEELQPMIIHRDIKRPKILLDKDWNAKIANVGLARPVEEDATQMATHIGGTLGYFSPEYASQGLLTEKLDMYNDAILVLEILNPRQFLGQGLPTDNWVGPTDPLVWFKCSFLSNVNNFRFFLLCHH